MHNTPTSLHHVSLCILFLVSYLFVLLYLKFIGININPLFQDCFFIIGYHVYTYLLNYLFFLFILTFSESFLKDKRFVVYYIVGFRYIKEERIDHDNPR